MKWFTRQGTTYEGAVKNINKSETSAEFTRIKKCSRCGGAGKSEAWRHTGLTCFKCGGSGSLGRETVKVYSADKLAKLDEAQAKRDQKKQDEQRANQLEKVLIAKARMLKTYEANKELIDEALTLIDSNVALRSMLEQLQERGTLTEKQLAFMAKVISDIRERQASPSQYVGEVGERIEITVKVESVFRKEVPAWGYGGGAILRIINMVDINDNVYVVMSTSFMADEGELLRLKGTVKEHKEFRDIKQTQLTRVKVSEVLTKTARSEIFHKVLFR